MCQYWFGFHERIELVSMRLSSLAKASLYLPRPASSPARRQVIFISSSNAESRRWHRRNTSHAISDKLGRPRRSQMVTLMMHWAPSMLLTFRSTVMCELRTMYSKALAILEPLESPILASLRRAELHSAQLDDSLALMRRYARLCFPVPSVLLASSSATSSGWALPKWDSQLSAKLRHVMSLFSRATDTVSSMAVTASWWQPKSDCTIARFIRAYW